ncbi:MAG: inner membrane CreD family protein, partial [Cyanobacteriota bacterium]|nr:inner membrane CreD family protein [Cyanobacteriota bacterium]
MQAVLRISAVLVILILTSIAWSILGTNMGFRTDRAANQLTDDVVELWGRPLQQAPPSMSLVWEEEEIVEEDFYDPKLQRNFKEKKSVKTAHTEVLLPTSSDVQADIRLDPRRRGLMWFALYDVDFQAQYSFVNHTERSENAEIRFRFPTEDGVYDNFRVLVDGQDVAAAIGSGGPLTRIPVTPGQEVRIVVGYRSRGLDSWSYHPNQGVGVVENLNIAL